MTVVLTLFRATLQERALTCREAQEEIEIKFMIANGNMEGSVILLLEHASSQKSLHQNPRLANSETDIAREFCFSNCMPGQFLGFWFWLSLLLMENSSLHYSSFYKIQFLIQTKVYIGDCSMSMMDFIDWLSAK